jgi:basic membrane protein A and related proteins
MNTKRFTIFGLLIVAAMLIAACGGAATGAKTEGKLKAVYIIGGTLGDKSFVDSTDRGLKQAVTDYGIEYIPVEASSDPAKIDAAFNDALNDPTVNFIIQSQGDLTEKLLEIAPKYPEKKFIVYDNPFDFEKCPECKANVYAMQYAQNEGSYLAGYYAGLMSKSKVIGAVGGQDIPVIQDFMIGYKQGAVDAGVKEENVLVQFANSWSDPAKGKELALTMYQQGADVIFQVAGGTGEGVFYAAQEADKWAIGVDSDQALIIEEANPEQAKHILTSMLKNVDKSMVRLFKLNSEGKLPWGTNELLGIAQEGVGLALNKYYEENTPQEVKDKMTAIIAKVTAGEIKVKTVF